MFSSHKSRPQRGDGASCSSSMPANGPWYPIAWPRGLIACSVACSVARHGLFRARLDTKKDVNAAGPRRLPQCAVKLVERNADSPGWPRQGCQPPRQSPAGYPPKGRIGWVA